MPLRLYNTLTKREEEFVPRDPKRVTMYTCGPTVYGRPHVGNYASFLMADLLRRWLEAGHGYTVEHVKNITDVGHLLHDADHGDDKVQKEAEKARVHPLEVARKYEELYLQDERDLLLLEPKYRPRASDYVRQMLTIIKTLLEKGNAYETEDGIYFDVTSKTPTPYGALSGNTVENISAGARVTVNEKKRHPSDFALWKKCVGDNAKHILRWSWASGDVSASTGEDPSSGFPGWHIECSAMASSLLGEQIDLHTGGEDNIFPHHECEIAQSEAAFVKKPFVRIWLHRRRIEVTLRQAQGGSPEVSQKMSKSLGNILDLPSLVAKGYSPLDVRYFLLSVHYRTNLKFSWQGLDDAKKARHKIVEWMYEVESGKWKVNSEKMQEVSKAFSEAMDADLNVSAALAVVFEAMSLVRTGALSGTDERALSAFVERARHTFGCFAYEEEGIPAHLEAILQEREKARAEKNFTESDRLRLEIEKRGFVVKDTKEGQRVSKK